MNFAQIVNRKRKVSSSYNFPSEAFAKSIVFNNNDIYVREIGSNSLQYNLGDFSFKIYGINKRIINNEEYFLKNVKVIINQNHINNWTVDNIVYSDAFYLNQIHPHVNVSHIYKNNKRNYYKTCLGTPNGVEITNLSRNKNYEHAAYKLIDILKVANTINPYINISDSSFNYSWLGISQCSYCKIVLGSKNLKSSKDKNENTICVNCECLMTHIRNFAYSPTVVKKCNGCGYYKMKIRQCIRCSQ